MMVDGDDWCFDSIGDVSGQVYVCTGANSGLGLHYCRHLYARGAHVIMACRSSSRASQAQQDIMTEFPQSTGSIRVLTLDLADLDTVHSCIHELTELLQHNTRRVNVLCNNAGIMMIPLKSTTKQGIETQLQTNHLGHFLLTGLMFKHQLFDKNNARIVNVTSLRHWDSKGIHFTDINLDKKYSPNEAYFQSKLANLLFTLELKHRCAETKVRSLAAHPGYAKTNLQSPMEEGSNVFVRFILESAESIFAQSAEMGAAPLLRASTDPTAVSGDCYGPKGFHQMKGAPIVVSCSKLASDENAAKELWMLSEKLCWFEWPSLDHYYCEEVKE